MLFRFSSVILPLPLSFPFLINVHKLIFDSTLVFGMRHLQVERGRPEARVTSIVEASLSEAGRNTRRRRIEHTRADVKQRDGQHVITCSNSFSFNNAYCATWSLFLDRLNEAEPNHMELRSYRRRFHRRIATLEDVAQSRQGSTQYSDEKENTSPHICSFL